MKTLTTLIALATVAAMMWMIVLLFTGQFFDEESSILMSTEGVFIVAMFIIGSIVGLKGEWSKQKVLSLSVGLAGLLCLIIAIMTHF